MRCAFPRNQAFSIELLPKLCHLLNITPNIIRDVSGNQLIILSSRADCAHYLDFFLGVRTSLIQNLFLQITFIIGAKCKSFTSYNKFTFVIGLLTYRAHIYLFFRILEIFVKFR